MRRACALALAFACGGGDRKPAAPRTQPSVKASVASSVVVPGAEPALHPADKPAPPPPPPVKVTHRSPTGVEETCQLLVPFPFTPSDVAADPASYRWYRDKDVEAIEKMCAWDLYGGKDDSLVGVCPKIHWSSPALELHDITKGELSKAEFEKKQCAIDRKKRGAKKLAKWKVHIYAREPESGLMYFHFSRLLGNLGFVYPATYRSIARVEAVRWSNEALATIQGTRRTEPGMWHYRPRTGWAHVRNRWQKSTDDVVYGSLAKNPRGEAGHKAFKYVGEIPLATAALYRKQPYHRTVNSDRPLALKFDARNAKRYQAALQSLVHAHDYTHFVIMDHLFHQRDRPGNIDGEIHYHYLEDGKLRWSKTKPTDRPSVALERLLLKDNDEALSWKHYGSLVTSHLIDDLNHLDSVTYERIQWLAGLMSEDASKDAVAAYFRDVVHIEPEVYEAVRKRMIDLAKRLKAKHDKGKLFLDLDLEPAFAKLAP